MSSCCAVLVSRNGRNASACAGSRAAAPRPFTAACALLRFTTAGMTSVMAAQGGRLPALSSRMRLRMRSVRLRLKIGTDADLHSRASLTRCNDRRTQSAASSSVSTLQRSRHCRRACQSRLQQCCAPVCVERGHAKSSLRRRLQHRAPYLQRSVDCQLRLLPSRLHVAKAARRVGDADVAFTNDALDIMRRRFGCRLQVLRKRARVHVRRIFWHVAAKPFGPLLHTHTLSDSISAGSVGLHADDALRSLDPVLQVNAARGSCDVEVIVVDADMRASAIAAPACSRQSRWRTALPCRSSGLRLAHHRPSGAGTLSCTYMPTAGKLRIAVAKHSACRAGIGVFAESNLKSGSVDIKCAWPARCSFNNKCRMNDWHSPCLESGKRVCTILDHFCELVKSLPCLPVLAVVRTLRNVAQARLDVQALCPQQLLRTCSFVRLPVLLLAFSVAVSHTAEWHYCGSGVPDGLGAPQPVQGVRSARRKLHAHAVWPRLGAPSTRANA